jgi:hypothetical protein
MLGDTLRRKHSGRKVTAAAGASGWVAFAIMLVLFLGLQARYAELIHGVAEYQVEMERQMATATTYAYQMQSALQQCEETGRGGDFVGGALRLGLPLLLEGISGGLPRVLLRLLADELGS